MKTRKQMLEVKRAMNNIEIDNAFVFERHRSMHVVDYYGTATLYHRVRETIEKINVDWTIHRDVVDEN